MLQVVKNRHTEPQKRAEKPEANQVATVALVWAKLSKIFIREETAPLISSAGERQQQHIQEGN